jgi:hypothetical protein
MKQIHINKLTKERSSFIKNVEVKYKNEFDILEQIYILGKSMSKQIKMKGTGGELWNGLLLVACIRTISGIESIVQLILLGNATDSALICRSIFDLLVNIRYIEQDIPLRSLLFGRFESNEYLKFLKRQIDYYPAQKENYTNKVNIKGNEIKTFDSDIKALDPKLKIPTGSKWSGKTIEVIAREAGLSFDYSLMYWKLSAISHSTSTSSMFYVRFNNSNNSLEPIYYPNDIIAREVTRPTAFFTLDILDVVNAHLSLGKELGIQQLKKKIKNAFIGNNFA